MAEVTVQAPWSAQFYHDELRYEVLRVCRKTETVELVAVFRDQEEAVDYADEFVETDQFDAMVRERSAPATAPVNE